MAGFILLRLANVYGDRPWIAGAGMAESAMSFLNVTKYPPSLLFIALTLGVGLLLLAWLEYGRAGLLAPLAAFGAAPMFFYLLHLYVLKLTYVTLAALMGPGWTALLPLEGAALMWSVTAVMAALLFPAVRAFGQLKSRRRDLAWLRYL